MSRDLDSRVGIIGDFDRRALHFGRALLVLVALVAIVVVLYVLESSTEGSAISLAKEVMLAAVGAWLGYVVGKVVVDRERDRLVILTAQSSSNHMHTVAYQTSQLALQARGLGTNQSSRLRFSSIARELDAISTSIKVAIGTLGNLVDRPLPPPREILEIQAESSGVTCPATNESFDIQLSKAPGSLLEVECPACNNSHHLIRLVGEVGVDHGI